MSELENNRVNYNYDWFSTKYKNNNYYGYLFGELIKKWLLNIKIDLFKLNDVEIDDIEDVSNKIASVSQFLDYNISEPYNSLFLYILDMFVNVQDESPQ